MQNETAFSNDIAIIHKTYNLYLCLYHTIETIPKKDRFTIGAKCENTSLAILEKLYEANAKYGQNRLIILQSVDTKLKILQALVKALFDIKAINDKKYLQLSELLVEIGRMLGGWIKTTKS
jgi:four helix bundle protein